MLQHFARPFEICNHSIDQRSDYRNISCFAPLHLACFLTDGNYFTGDFIDSYDRRLIDNNASATHSYDRTRRTHIDRHRIRHEVPESIEPNERTSFTYE